ncbi:MAG: DUF167 domain-containing protein [Candidatus Magasanikbacteria bacterium]|nr:DUF167 domain-containing protein [Candidatus Magasanikbacteria bacterium]
MDKIIEIKVLPKSSKNSVVFDAEKNIYKIKITEVPEKGKANKKVIELLSKYLHTPKTSITIIRGKTSKNKVVKITSFT